jgi:hypothetical protein
MSTRLFMNAVDSPLHVNFGSTTNLWAIDITELGNICDFHGLYKNVKFKVVILPVK